jgi:hypothetical protein
VHALRATIRGTFAVAAAALLWASIIVLVVLVVVASFFFVMIVAITAICGSVRPAAALAIDSIGHGFDRAIEAFDDTGFTFTCLLRLHLRSVFMAMCPLYARFVCCLSSGIVNVLGDVEAQANDALWFLPLDMGLSHGVQTTFVRTINELDSAAVNMTTAYEKTLEKVKDARRGFGEALERRRPERRR